MKKIAIIGAGSVIFCKTLMMDILATPALSDSEFRLMAPSTRNTSQVKAFMDKVISSAGLSAAVHLTTDRREALAGADYVILCYSIGGLRAYEIDCEVSLKYGVDICIGDTLAPGGIFRALRTIPVTRELCADVRELCPGALILNYVNPMAAVCWTLGLEGMNFVGLCHGVQTTLDLIAGYTGVPKHEVDFTCAGINHMAWFTRLYHNGVDLYPKLKEVFEKPEYYVNDKVRGEVLRNFGYFCTESTGHLSEYLPYFRKNKKALELYCDQPDFGGETNANLKFTRYVAQKLGGRILDDDVPELGARSVEYCSYILEALATGAPFRFNGNVINNGLIANLPQDCCAEGPIIADADGLHRQSVGELPWHLAALNQTNISCQRLTVQAAYSGEPEEVVHAVAMDPLASAVLTLGEIREMCAEVLEKQAEWLPQFAGKKLAPRPVISIPADVVPEPVPVDPALAVMGRFAQLGK
ncbi:MAG: alpha-galactosidase [Eubacteriales bacterium]|nr:alpha-galactosidase [Eubacteriales bacterium]